MIKEKRFFVKGMHCASCEILVEKKLLELKGVKSVEASVNRGEVLVEYEGLLPSAEALSRIFTEEGYSFLFKDIFQILAVCLLIITGFVVFQKTGLTALVNVTKQSSLPVFFVFGLLAGVSSCAALVGGMILSMAKQWEGRKVQPHLIFNAGRIVSYGVLGAVLGGIGSKLNFSLNFGPVLVIAVSVMMVFLALQMLGFKAFRKFQFTMPKFITRFIANESNFKGRYMPFLMGAFTFFLPCGFTITVQGLALISGNAIQGGLIMFLFALGTLPMLLTIGLSSVKFSQKPHLSERFLKVAGILVLFFALYNLNFQLNVLGIRRLSDSTVRIEGLAPVVGGKQILKMEASAQGYRPNYFKVKIGLPVRWEITDKGTSGCTNAVISKGLFDGEIKLTPGQTSIKEFTPEKQGQYKFSCWMGMVSGIIEVVDSNAAAKNSGGYVQTANVADVNDEDVIPSGAQGCGCGGGSGSCGAR